MGIYTRYTTAVLTLLLAIAAASTAHSATLHPVPSIAKALAAGPSGVMPSGLTVQRSQQLGVMLLKANTQLALGSGTVVPVTRGASLSVGGLARGAVSLLKNSSPPKLIGTAVIGGAISLLPGARVYEGEFQRIEPGPAVPPSGSSDYRWQGYLALPQGKHSTPSESCESMISMCNSQYGSSQRVRTFLEIVPSGDYSFRCRYELEQRQSDNSWKVSGTVTSCNGHPANTSRVGTQCPQGSTYDRDTGVCRGSPAYVPFSASDFDALEGAIPSSDPSPADVKDFWFNLCGGDGTCMGSYTSDPTLSGPASVQGPKTTTTSTGPNGTTTTTKDTHHDLDYSNPDGVVVRDRTTTTTTDPDGNTTTDTTVDTGPVVGAKPDEQSDLEGSFSDTPFPEVEPFYEQKYPDGLQGVWAARKAEFEDSAFMDFLGSFVPSFSGSCPSWSLNVNVASWAQFGIHDFQTLCWVFDFIKVVMLVTAAFLCRALIFGG